MIILSAETTIDIPEELLAQYDIHVLPYTIVMGDKEFRDGQVKGEDLFAYTDETGKLARTAAVNREEFQAHFESLLKDHPDADIIHFTLSSEMSAAYNNACAVAEGFGGHVHIIDSRVLSTGIALQAIYARKLIDAGYSVDEIIEKVKERIPYDQTSFGLESVNYLYKGGRCSALAMLGANLLGLRPQILVVDGKMKPGKKFRGKMRKWSKDYIDATLAQFNNPDHEVVFITYSSVMHFEVIEWAKARLEQEGFKTIYVTRANGTICCHCGPKCLGILYFNDGDHPVTPKQ